MRFHSSSRAVLATLCLVFLTSVAVSAQVLYDNGAINGETDAWPINFGFVVSDSFVISTGNSTINGLSFNAWLFPGDLLESVEVDITSEPFGGTTYFDQQVSITQQSNCFDNEFGHLVCNETASFNGPTLGNGTYFLNLKNAMSNTGDPVYWDENSGIGCTSPGCPDQGVGTIPSESFTLLGSSSGNGSVPEPSSLALLATGAFGIAGILRRR